MRYRSPATEFEAIQWTGSNIQELWDRFGAGNIYGPTEANPHPIVTPNGRNILEGIPLTAVGDWVIGSRVKSGWSLDRLTDEQFQAGDWRPAYRDRNDHYVPDDLPLDSHPQFVEIAEARPVDPRVLRNLIEVAATLITGAAARLSDTTDPGGRPHDIGPLRQWLTAWADHEEDERPARTARLAMVGQSKHEPDQSWTWWVDMSQEPHADGRPHWSAFRGHRVQVDIELTTANRREVNEWKGRDGIRGGGEWLILLNRQPVDGGHFGTDVFYALRQIEAKLRALLDDSSRVPLDHTSGVSYVEQLMGQRVYYGTTPAMVTNTVLSQGCVILQPVGVDHFPRSAYELDAEPDGTGHDEQDLYDVHENRTVKVRIDSRDITWHRRRPFSPDEPDERYHPRPPRGTIEGGVSGAVEGAEASTEGEGTDGQAQA